MTADIPWIDCSERLPPEGVPVETLYGSDAASHVRRLLIVHSGQWCYLPLRRKDMPNLPPQPVFFQPKCWRLETE